MRKGEREESEEGVHLLWTDTHACCTLSGAFKRLSPGMCTHGETHVCACTRTRGEARMASSGEKIEDARGAASGQRRRNGEEERRIMRVSTQRAQE